uniref:DDE Tnp4 domain-containing protein n=1 Tax=Oryzias latipes TaxID=8090 RepID=A0A3P9HJ43_ORYLA
MVFRPLHTPRTLLFSSRSSTVLFSFSRALSSGVTQGFFQLGVSTVASIVSETCDALWHCLRDEHFPVPTEEMWRSTARRFHERWNFPNCLGAMDGKHIFIQTPANSGSLYFNYKGTFSVVLLAVVDADYRFLVVDVGSYGSNSDGGIFANSVLGKALRDGTLNVPPPSELPGAPELGKVNHVIVADEAFPLKPYLLRHTLDAASPQTREFSIIVCLGYGASLKMYLASSVNASGFSKALQVQPSVVDKVVKAACALCNYLQDDHDWQWASVEAQNVRELYKEYFNSPAEEVAWQYDHVNHALGNR